MKNKLKVVPALAILGLAVGLAKVVVVYNTNTVKLTLNDCQFVQKEKTYTIGDESVKVTQVCGPTDKVNFDLDVEFNYNYAIDTNTGKVVDLSKCTFDMDKGLVCPENTPSEYKLQLDGFVYVTYSNGQFTCTDKFGNNAVTANTFKECILKYFTQGLENAPVTVSVTPHGIMFTVNAQAGEKVFEFGASDTKLVYYDYYTKFGQVFGVSDRNDNTFVLSEVANSAFASKVKDLFADITKAVTETQKVQTTQTTTTQPTQTTQPQENKTQTQPKEQATQPTQPQGKETTTQTAQEKNQTQAQVEQTKQKTEMTQEEKKMEETKVTQKTQTQGGFPIIYLVAAAVVIAAVAGAVYFLKQKQGQEGGAA